ncbi:MAG: dicarboxylate/amino acid:cation symporter [Bacteroidetes bacterium MED-G17]|nr:MAG: dicarboxylate/amino acid:cation symporter [Bacteroidetes bacterium MED-G17]CAI8356334.1 MAG: Proton/sodium-glutamate symport protein [Bacteroidetes bacterium MED-G17]|tara:strand:+ start:16754 stop:18142 length:1389 start_codon:yes stop_codon:yes gene_type:complete
MRKIPLHWQVIVAILLGVLFSFLAIQFNFREFCLLYIAPFGDIFINILKLIAVPLVLFSIIAGVASLGNVKKLGNLGIKTLATYLFTTMTAVFVGLLVVNIWKPGKDINPQLRLEKRIEYELWQKKNNVKKLDTICLSCDQNNLHIVQKIQNNKLYPNKSDFVQDKIDKAKQNKTKSPLQPIVDLVPKNLVLALLEMKMLQIIFFAIFMGLVLVTIAKEKAKPVIELIEGLNEVFVQMVNIIMVSMPFFVFALMVGTLTQSASSLGDLTEQLYFLTNYSGAVIIGLLFMAFVFYPIFISFFKRKINARKFLKGISKAQLTAFSTSSSVATLPITMDCVQNKLGVSQNTTSFVIPIGATVNMDGTSLYQAVAVVALAQFHMIDLGLSQQLTIVLTATLASIGAAAVPSAGLVLMIVVLESVGLNPIWIAIILPVDRILDMCRTVVNVTGDAAVSLIMDKQKVD